MGQQGRGSVLNCHMSISASFLQPHRAWHQEKWDPGAMALSMWAAAAVITQQRPPPPGRLETRSRETHA